MTGFSAFGLGGALFTLAFGSGVGGGGGGGGGASGSEGLHTLRWLYLNVFISIDLPHFSHDIIDGSFFVFCVGSGGGGDSIANVSTTGSDLTSGSDGCDYSLTSGCGVSTGASCSTGTTLTLPISIYFSIEIILSIDFL